MGLNRKQIEDRIFEILTYIGKDTLAFPLKQNINLFSVKELEQLLEFLERGNYEHIFQLLDNKYKEYLGIIEEIKMMKIGEKKKDKLKEEKEERQQENYELELLLNF